MSKEKKTDADACNQPREVGGKACENSVADLADSDGAKVHSKHVEGGLRGAIEDAGEVSDVGVGPVGVNVLDHQCAGA